MRCKSEGTVKTLRLRSTGEFGRKIRRESPGTERKRFIERPAWHNQIYRPSCDVMSPILSPGSISIRS